jgi:hypothetical protein
MKGATMSNTQTSAALVELTADEARLTSGGEYVAIQPWAIGTSGALQAAIVAKLEILGNPIGPSGH